MRRSEEKVEYHKYPRDGLRRRTSIIVEVRMAA